MLSTAILIFPCTKLITRILLGLLVGCLALQIKPEENPTLGFLQLSIAAMQVFASVRSWVILNEL